MQADARFRAMGSDAHVTVVGDPRLAERARSIIEDLEHAWSRFIPDSELSRLNVTGSLHPATVETLMLVGFAVHATHLTDGLFDPTVHDAVIAAGYDRTFTEGLSRAKRAATAAVPGVASIVVDPDTCAIRLPAGVHLDAGGIGKGLAADLVVSTLMSDGASGVCVNIGGDLRVAGTPPEGGGWRIAITHPVTDVVLATLSLRSGGVATSSPLRRRWVAADKVQHHIIDPRTRRPARTAVASATVTASTCWLAEAAAKAAVISGSVAAGRVALEHLELGGVLVDQTGSVSLVGGVREWAEASA